MTGPSASLSRWTETVRGLSPTATLRLPGQIVLGIKAEDLLEGACSDKIPPQLAILLMGPLKIDVDVPPSARHVAHVLQEHTGLLTSKEIAGLLTHHIRL